MSETPEHACPRCECPMGWVETLLSTGGGTDGLCAYCVIDTGAGRTAELRDTTPTDTAGQAIQAALALLSA